MGTPWDEEQYRKAYRMRQWNPDLPQFGEVITYGRTFAMLMRAPWGEDLSWYKHELDQLRTKTPINPASNVLVVGCGFGFLIETLKRPPINARYVWGIDISPWIHANKANETTPEVADLILDVDLLAPDAAAQLDALGAGKKGRFNWIVSELVTEGFSDAELPAMFDACDALRTSGPTGVVHVFASRGGGAHDPTLGMIWRTGPELEALAAGWDHWFLDIHTWEIFGGPD